MVRPFSWFLISLRSGGSRRGAMLAACLSVTPLASASAAAPSQQADPPAAVLTLADALSRAEAASPLVRRARVEREEVAAREVGASILFPTNPVIGGAVGPRREVDRQGLEVLLHAEQTIEIAGQRGARREVVSRSLRTAMVREQVARAETRARVRSAYVGAQLARAQVNAARQREALVTQLLEAVQARVSGGASSDVDLQLARLERGSAARARVDAALAAADASARLRLLVGRGPGETLELDAALAVPTRPTGTLAALLARAESQRAELAAVLSTRDEIDADLVRLRREAIPSPTVFVDVERDLPGQLFVGAGLAVPLPIWRRQQGEIAIARAARGRAEEELTLVRRDVALEVERAFQADEAQREMVELMAREVLPAGESAIALMTEGWRAGKFDLFRLIQTSRDASEARRLYLETLGLLWESAIALDRAVGAP